MSGEEDSYIIEHIHKIKRIDGVKKCKVHWKGYDCEENDTWELFDDVESEWSDVIDQYQKQRDQRKLQRSQRKQLLEEDAVHEENPEDKDKEKENDNDNEKGSNKKKRKSQVRFDLGEKKAKQMR